MLVKPRTAAVVGVIGVALAILGAGAGAQDPDADPQSHTCLPTKKWSIKGEDVVANSRGNVTLVALLSASCGFCIRQAFFISLLKDRMEQEGHYFNAAIVNEASMLSMLYSLKLQEATSLKIPVYQETHQDPVWEILGGSRDDILLYDRCGRLAFHIPMPFSDILSPFQFVQKSLKQVLENKDLCGPCQDEALDTEETQEAQQEPQQEQIEVPAEIVQEIEEIQQLKDDLPTDEDEPKEVQCTVVFDETTSTSVTNCEDPVLQLPSDLDVVKEVLPPPMDALEETEIDIKLQRLDDVDGEDFALPATDLEPLNRAEHAPRSDISDVPVVEVRENPPVPEVDLTTEPIPALPEQGLDEELKPNNAFQPHRPPYTAGLDDDLLKLFLTSQPWLIGEDHQNPWSTLLAPMQPWIPVVVTPAPPRRVYHKARKYRNRSKYNNNRPHHQVMSREKLYRQYMGEEENMMDVEEQEPETIRRIPTHAKKNYYWKKKKMYNKQRKLYRDEDEDPSAKFADESYSSLEHHNHFGESPKRFIPKRKLYLRHNHWGAADDTLSSSSSSSSEKHHNPEDEQQQQQTLMLMERTL